MLLIDLRAELEVVPRTLSVADADLQGVDVARHVRDGLGAPDALRGRVGKHQHGVAVSRPDVRQLLDDDLPVLARQLRDETAAKSPALGLVALGAAAVDLEPLLEVRFQRQRPLDLASRLRADLHHRRARRRRYGLHFGQLEKIQAVLQTSLGPGGVPPGVQIDGGVPATLTRLQDQKGNLARIPQQRPVDAGQIRFEVAREDGRRAREKESRDQDEQPGTPDRARRHENDGAKHAIPPLRGA